MYLGGQDEIGVRGDGELGQDGFKLKVTNICAFRVEILEVL